MSRKPQIELLQKQKDAYGGVLRNTRAGRMLPRPLSTKYTMHLVLRSSRATGKWSMTKHRQKIDKIVSRFSDQFGVKVISYANVGNHLHFQIKLTNRYTYKGFIRALTSSIAMAVTGASRWNPLEGSFWSQRPFTRVVASLKYSLRLKDYIEVNRLEGWGANRDEARFLLEDFRRRPWKYHPS